ncbi:MAG: sel1 repeat family protein [Enterocloster asparagiformis]|nr:sel1 repeat family protein [Enterocloster asparagiformis]
MGQFYSDVLEQGIRLLYFQADPALFSRGVELVEQAVEAGEPDACYYLSRCYAWEDGNVKEDDWKARRLLKEGIGLGSDLCVLGAVRMGALKGEVRAAMRRSLRDSFDAVMKMAEAGEPMAQYAVGLFYFWGDMLANFQLPAGEDPDRCRRENAAEALRWFRLSAEQGCVPAFRNAFNGVRGGLNSIPKDQKEALRWAESVKDKVDMRDYRYSMVKEYQELKDYENANRWCRLGVENGDTSCMVSMGVVYLEGDQGLPMDQKEALRLFGLAAEGGNEYGYYNMGRCYYNGWGCSQDYRRAFELFSRASSMGHPTADTFLSRCYYYGRGVQEDQAAAFRLAKAQKDRGRTYPGEILGLCYLYGRGTAPDYAMAKKLLEEAGTDYYAVCIGLGDIYSQGLGVAVDLGRAVSYYQNAASRGNAEAGERMKQFKKTFFGKWKHR